MMGDAEKNLDVSRADDHPLSGDDLTGALAKLPGWQLVKREGIDRLERAFRFRNFAQALAFTARVGEAAEASDHHPAILTEWGKVTVTWWTHRIKGLHRNDFAMARRTDDLYSPD